MYSPKDVEIDEPSPFPLTQVSDVLQFIQCDSILWLDVQGTLECSLGIVEPPHFNQYKTLASNRHGKVMATYVGADFSDLRVHI